MRIEGPGDGDIEQAIQRIARLIDGQQTRFVASCVVGAQGLLKRAYNKKVYSGAESLFGYPRDKNQTLAQSVLAETNGLNGRIYTDKREAAFVEYGTGIYSRKGGQSRITPKRGKFLAFPVWRLPKDFKGRFIPRQKARNLPYDAIGLVLTKSVKGMKPRPVWTDRDVLDSVKKLMVVEAKNAAR